MRTLQGTRMADTQEDSDRTPLSLGARCPCQKYTRPHPHLEKDAEQRAGM